MSNNYIRYGKIVLCSGLAAFCILLSGCTQTTYELSDGVYLNSNSDEDSIQAAISLRVSENEFDFGFITQDSTFLVSGLKGTVAIEEDTVSAITDGGTLTFTFRITGDNTICFVQNESDDLVMANGDTEFGLTDGMEFTLVD